MRMIFIFIDGFGIGIGERDRNPLVGAHSPNIDYIFKTFDIINTDVLMGVPGLPQSATGQTAIFTGVNAAKILGRHMNGQPTVTLKKIIENDNLFKKLKRRGFSITNANVYRQEYLEKMLDSRDRMHRPSVTSVMTLSAGLRFRTVQDYKEGNGIYHDITGQIIKDSGYDVDIITPDEAAKRLYSISRENDFTLYEHFMTDIIGHKMDMEMAIREIELLDAFLGGLMKLVNLEEDIVLITSDHGNIEDISVKTHTMNKVPTVIIGRLPGWVRLEINSIVDVMSAVLDIFDCKEKTNG